MLAQSSWYATISFPIQPPCFIDSRFNVPRVEVGVNGRAKRQVALRCDQPLPVTVDRTSTLVRALRRGKGDSGERVLHWKMSPHRNNSGGQVYETPRIPSTQPKRRRTTTPPTSLLGFTTPQVRGRPMQVPQTTYAYSPLITSTQQSLADGSQERIEQGRVGRSSEQTHQGAGFQFQLSAFQTPEPRSRRRAFSFTQMSHFGPLTGSQSQGSFEFSPLQHASQELSPTRETRHSNDPVATTGRSTGNDMRGVERTPLTPHFRSRRIRTPPPPSSSA